MGNLSKYADPSSQDDFPLSNCEREDIWELNILVWSHSPEWIEEGILYEEWILKSIKENTDARVTLWDLVLFQRFDSENQVFMYGYS